MGFVQHVDIIYSDWFRKTNRTQKKAKQISVHLLSVQMSRTKAGLL